MYVYCIVMKIKCMNNSRKAQRNRIKIQSQIRKPQRNKIFGHSSYLYRSYKNLFISIATFMLLQCRVLFSVNTVTCYE